MTLRLIPPLLLAVLLAACGACEGYVSNSGNSAGRCSVLTLPW